MTEYVFAIDPGPTHSAWVSFDLAEEIPRAFGYQENHDVLKELDERATKSKTRRVLAVEWIESFGMPVGQEVFQTCAWIGRFEQACYHWFPRYLVTRGQVKLEICKDTRAKDANIRAALIDLYGGKQKAIGTKRDPGPLYSIKGHLWSALAVAVTFQRIQSTLKATT